MPKERDGARTGAHLCQVRKKSYEPPFAGGRAGTKTRREDSSVPRRHSDPALQTQISDERSISMMLQDVHEPGIGDETERSELAHQAMYFPRGERKYTARKSHGEAFFVRSAPLAAFVTLQ